MEMPSKIRFKVINKISQEQLLNSHYVIYGHQCSEGLYIGMTDDPVKRWNEHYKDAFNTESPYYNDTFKVAIRKHGSTFSQLIIAIANTEREAKIKEAAAIEYYKSQLNTKTERVDSERDFGFSSIESQLGYTIFLEKKKGSGAYSSRNDSQRKTVIGEIYEQEGRKRLRTISNQVFPEGMKIECSREERNRFNVGDKVRINVALSEKRGTKYLVAAKTAKLVLVN